MCFYFERHDSYGVDDKANVPRARVESGGVYDAEYDPRHLLKRLLAVCRRSI